MRIESFWCYNMLFAIRRSWHGLGHGIRARNFAETEAETMSHDIHGRSAGEFGEGLCSHAISGRLHQRGAGANNRLNWGENSSVVLESSRETSKELWKQYGTTKQHATHVWTAVYTRLQPPLVGQWSLSDERLRLHELSTCSGTSELRLHSFVPALVVPVCSSELQPHFHALPAE